MIVINNDPIHHFGFVFIFVFGWGWGVGGLKLGLHFDCAMKLRSSMLGLYWVDVEVACFFVGERGGGPLALDVILCMSFINHQACRRTKCSRKVESITGWMNLLNF